LSRAFVDASGFDTNYRIVDYNADGMPDVLSMAANDTTQNKGQRADQLTSITFPQGGTETISYKGSHQYRDPYDNPLSPKLPLFLQVVDRVILDDGSGNTASTSYTYKDGDFYYNGPFDRRISGFAKVTKKDAAGNKTVTYFHQGNSSSSSWGE